MHTAIRREVKAGMIAVDTIVLVRLLMGDDPKQEAAARTCSRANLDLEDCVARNQMGIAKVV